MGARLNLKGRRFGRTKVLKPAKTQYNRTRWKCICDCGVEFIANTMNLMQGNTKSCGCLRSGMMCQLALQNI